MLRLILGWIARLVEDRRMAPCRALHPAELGELYRALTNGEFGAFDASRRIAVDWESLPWRTLPGLLKEGAALAEQVAVQRAARGSGTAEGRHRRAGLRARDPW